MRKLAIIDEDRDDSFVSKLTHDLLCLFDYSGFMAEKNGTYNENRQSRNLNEKKQQCLSNINLDLKCAISGDDI